MPELQDIELFKNKINSLGNEEQILAEKGEKIIDVAPPEQGVPDDISALLNDIADTSDSPEDSSIETPLDDVLSPFDDADGALEPPDEIFDTNLDNIPSETAEEETTFDDDLGNISNLDDMFEDTEPEDDSSLMPDDLVDQDAETAGTPLSLDDIPGPSEDLGDDDFSAIPADDFNLPETPESENLSEDTFDLPESDELSNADAFSDFDVTSDSSGTDDMEAFDLPDDLDAFDNDDFSSEGELESAGPEEFDISALDDDFSVPDIGSETSEMTGEAENISDDIDLPEDDFSLDELSSDDEFAEISETGDAEDAPAEDVTDADELDSFDMPDDIGELENSEETENLDDLDSFSEFDDAEISDESSDISDLDSFDLPQGLDSEPESEDELELEPQGGSDDDFDLGSLDDISLEDELEIDTDMELSPDGGLDDLAELEELGSFDSTGESGEDTDSLSGESDEFSLEDLGEEYSSLEEIDESLPEPAAAVPALDAAASDFGDSSDNTEFSIVKERLDKVTETLNRLPRNLKLIIEDLIGNRGLAGRRLENLVNKLADGASVKEIAGLTEKIIGRKIKIPSQYERKTWEELEEEKQTFSYILKHNILPYAGKIALFSIALFFAVFVIKKQVYDPLYSSYLYDKGYEQLENDNYKASDKLFNKASRIRPFKKQFYKYAEGYIDKREYDRAEQKYTAMLGPALSSEREKNRKERQKGYFPTDKKGFLDYAALKTFYQGEYAESDRILTDFILQKGNKWDYDALLDKIDNYLNWGEFDRKQFDSAGYVLNDSLSKFGKKPELVFRKMAYYMHSGRIDDLEDKALKDISEGDSKSIDVRKYYSMLGEFRSYVENVKEKYADSYMISDFYRYMIDHDDVEGIEERLIAVSNQDKNLIEPHYQLSRYWKKMEKKDLERRALGTIETLLENNDTSSHIRENYPHSYNYAASQRNRIDILTNNRLGRFSYNDKEILEAQRYYKKAVDRFEKYSPLPGDTASYGHIYEDLGDIYYYNAGKYNDALKYFGKAYNTGYKNDNLDYKIGFINYKNRNYSKAAENFYDISLNARENEAALYAFANASFNYGVYSPAKAYYDRVIEKVEYWYNHEKFFDIERRSDQRQILEKLMQVYNNQGVTLFKLAEKNRNQEYYSKSLVYLSQSAELYDTLMRDPATMNKTLTKPLAQLNMKWILLNSGWKNMTYEKSVIPYSSDNMTLDSPVIYNSIDHDLYGKVNTSLK